MSWIISLLVAGMISAGSAPQPQPAPLPQTVKANFAGVEKTEIAPTTAQDTRFDQTYPRNPNGRVSLSNVNGKVDVEAWDRNEVRVEAIKRIQCEKPEDIEIEIDANPNWVRVETEFGKDRNIVVNRGDKNQRTSSNGYDNRCTEYSVDYKLTVPRNAQLDEVETVNGNVTLAGMSNVVKSSTVNGSVTAQNLRGSVNISTVNGTLNVGFDSLNSVREIKVDTVNGTLKLQLPSDVDAIVKASTVHGNISNDFGLPVKKGEYVGNNLYGKLGDGQIPIRLNTVNGTINIRRNPDGRSLKPAVNLLSQMDEPDFDSHGDFGPKVKAPKPPKPQRAKVRPNVVVSPPAPPTPVIEGSVHMDERTRQEIRKAIAESKKVAREAMKIDQEEIRRSVEEARASVPEIDVDVDLDVDIDLDMDDDAPGEYNHFALSRRQTYNLDVESAPNLNVTARNGAVRIRGWDKSEVSFNFTHQARESNYKPSLQKNGSDIRISIPETIERYRLEIFVPRKSNVKIMSGGEIRVDGVTGKVELDGGNGAIDVRDSGGNLSVTSREGRVRVIGFDGDARIKTTDGNIALEGNFTSLSTNTDSGETVLTLNKDASATLEATTKNVTFEGIEPNGEPKEARNSTVWKIGGGSSNYKLRTTADGQIYVRSASNVRISHNNFYLVPLRNPLFG
ncbi:MAG TPA: DUF4097 family beta strand repeat-containing protein [Pyrinomonadaceae bacterium]|nr:DUF4097 family beta strand repeat-containing protein [Pyrinomonadaceae bacterium]